MRRSSRIIWHEALAPETPSDNFNISRVIRSSKAATALNLEVPLNFCPRDQYRRVIDFTGLYRSPVPYGCNFLVLLLLRQTILIKRVFAQSVRH